MKKKFISLFLVFIFSFTLISSARQKETKAIALVAGYTISQILGALALSATVVGAGYAVTDSLVDPEDNSEFTDFLQLVFKQTLDMSKYEIPPPPEPLSTLESVTLLSMLTKQGIETSIDLYETVYDFFTNINDEPVPYDVIGTNGYIIRKSATSEVVTIWVATDPTTKLYLKSARDVYATKPVTRYYRGRDVESWQILVTNQNQSIVTLTENVKAVGNMPIYTDNTFSTISQIYSPVNGEVAPPSVDIPEIVIPPSSMVPPEEYVPTFKAIDMSPLNGLVRDDQELVEIINGNKIVSDYKYGKITEAFNEIYENYLKNPNTVATDVPVTPTISPTTGTKYYGEPLVDEPDIETPETPETELGFWGKVLYWLKAIWQTLRDFPSLIANKIGEIFKFLKDFISEFWMSFSTWWENNFIVHWTALLDWLNTLPGLISGAFTGLFDLVTIPLNALVGLIQDVWEWLQGVPEMIYGFFVPPSTDIAVVWDPVISLWQDKLEPVKAPLDQLLFHETELQDISADLEFNGIGGTYKIIDYQYVKSVKDQVKGVIRAFFWILIIFFNVDQVHRLIRNQGIIKSYVRKIDEPGGKS